MQAISTLFRLFFDICRFRLGPQDIPVSQTLLVVSLAAAILVSLAIVVVDPGVTHPVVAVSLSFLLFILFTIAVLQAFGKASRITQTLTALAGTDCVFSVLQFPLRFWIGQLDPKSPEAALPALLTLIVVGWNLLVVAHIYRHALSTRPIGGFLVTIAYFWLVISLLGLALPTPDANVGTNVGP